MQNVIFILFSPNFNLMHLRNFKGFCLKNELFDVKKCSKLKKKNQKILTIANNLTAKDAVHTNLHKNV